MKNKIVKIIPSSFQKHLEKQKKIKEKQEFLQFCGFGLKYVSLYFIATHNDILKCNVFRKYLFNLLLCN